DELEPHAALHGLAAALPPAAVRHEDLLEDVRPLRRRVVEAHAPIRPATAVGPCLAPPRRLGGVHALAEGRAVRCIAHLAEEPWRFLRELRRSNAFATRQAGCRVEAMKLAQPGVERRVRVACVGEAVLELEAKVEVRRPGDLGLEPCDRMRLRLDLEV